MSLKTNLKKVIKDQRGFTLFELTCVVLIISILVSIAILNHATTRRMAQRNTCKANLRILHGATRTFFMNNDDWPTGIDDLTGYPGYIKREPFCPTAQDDAAVINKSYRYDAATHNFTCPGVADGFGDPGEPYEGHTF